MATLQSRKKALRQAIKLALKALPASVIQSQSQLITSRVLSSPSFTNSQAIGCYLNMPSGEVITDGIIEAVIRTGKSLYVPRLTPAGMDMLKIHSMEDLLAMKAGLWGIREPEPEYLGQKRISVFDEDCEILDLILMPGVAFDSTLSRLGHGKGYYDTFLSKYTSGHRKPFLAALSLKEQIVPAGEVPIDNRDWKVDSIICPEMTMS